MKETGLPTQQDVVKVDRGDFGISIDGSLYDKVLTTEEFRKRNGHLDLSFLDLEEPRISLENILSYIGRFQEDNGYFVGAYNDGILNGDGVFTQSGFDQLVRIMRDRKRASNEVAKEREKERENGIKRFDLLCIENQVADFVDVFLPGARFNVKQVVEGRGKKKVVCLEVIVEIPKNGKKNVSFSTMTVRGYTEDELLKNLSEQLREL